MTIGWPIINFDYRLASLLAPKVPLDYLQLGQSSRPKKLSYLFLGHFWAKIRSDNCFEIVLTYRMA